MARHGAAHCSAYAGISRRHRPTCLLSASSTRHLSNDVNHVSLLQHLRSDSPTCDEQPGSETGSKTGNQENRQQNRHSVNTAAKPAAKPATSETGHETGSETGILFIAIPVFPAAKPATSTQPGSQPVSLPTLLPVLTSDNRQRNRQRNRQLGEERYDTTVICIATQNSHHSRRDLQRMSNRCHLHQHTPSRPNGIALTVPLCRA